MKIFFLLAFSFALPLSAGTYSLRFTQVPKSMASCHQEAKELEKLFILNSGVGNGEASCLDDKGKTANYEIKYNAEKPLLYTTTDVLSVSVAGLYKTARDCQERLHSAIIQFEKNTGIKSYLGYCKSDEMFSSPRWSPYIFGFGEGQTKFWINGYFYYSVPYKFDSIAFIEHLREKLRQIGADLAGVASIPSLGYGRMEIHYYAKDKIAFQLFELGQSPKLENCLANQERYISAMTELSIDPVTTYCGQVSVGGTWELTSLFAGASPISVRNSAERYSSIEECEGDRERLTQEYKSTIDAKIILGFCGRVENTYKVQFLKIKN